MLYVSSFSNTQGDAGLLLYLTHTDTGTQVQ